MKRLSLLTLSCLFLSSCGDFPEYVYEKSQQYCVMSFPFAGGFFDRKYVGYFNITSSLQYLDEDPEIQIFIGGPSHIEYEAGSVQKIEIDGQNFIPKFHKNFLFAELQYYGPAFTFDEKASRKIYQALQNSNDITIHGRLEIGRQYEASIYNFFFDDKEKPFKACVERLLSEEDLEQIKSDKVSE